MKSHLEPQSEADLALICVILSPIQTIIICRCGENEGFAATYNIDLTMLKSPTRKTTCNGSVYMKLKRGHTKHGVEVSTAGRGGVRCLGRAWGASRCRCSTPWSDPGHVGRFSL